MVMFWGEKIGCTIYVIYFVWVKIIILFLCIWLRKTDGSRIDVFLVDTYWLSSCNIGWNKIDMPDIINCDICIRTFILENNCQGFSSIDKNGEASY